MWTLANVRRLRPACCGVVLLVTTTACSSTHRERIKRREPKSYKLVALWEPSPGVAAAPIVAAKGRRQSPQEPVRPSPTDTGSGQPPPKKPDSEMGSSKKRPGDEKPSTSKPQEPLVDLQQPGTAETGPEGAGSIPGTRLALATDGQDFFVGTWGGESEERNTRGAPKAPKTVDVQNPTRGSTPGVSHVRPIRTEFGVRPHLPGPPRLGRPFAPFGSIFESTHNSGAWACALVRQAGLRHEPCGLVKGRNRR